MADFPILMGNVSRFCSAYITVHIIRPCCSVSWHKQPVLTNQVPCPSCLSVCFLVMTVYFGRMAKAIEMPFGVVGRASPCKVPHIRLSSASLMVKSKFFWGGGGRRNGLCHVTYRENATRPLSKLSGTYSVWYSIRFWRAADSQDATQTLSRTVNSFSLSRVRINRSINVFELRRALNCCKPRLMPSSTYRKTSAQEHTHTLHMNKEIKDGRLHPATQLMMTTCWSLLLSKIWLESWPLCLS